MKWLVLLSVEVLVCAVQVVPDIVLDSIVSRRRSGDNAFSIK